MRRPRFDGKRAGKLGTEDNPAAVSVPTETRAREIAEQLTKNGWKYILEIVPDKPENIADVQRLLNRPTPVTSEKKTDRNDPCPCGSGKKYKKCCGK